MKTALMAPGENVTSLGIDGKPGAFQGTSAATPFVAGAIALLLCEFREAGPDRVKAAVLQRGSGGRTSVVPPLLDAWAAWQTLATAHGGG